MDSDHWTWATSRPYYMREIEPLARQNSWPSPEPRPQGASVLAYRALTNERMRAEQERQQNAEHCAQMRVAAARKRAESLELNSDRKGERNQIGKSLTA